MKCCVKLELVVMKCLIIVKQIKLSAKKQVSEILSKTHTISNLVKLESTYNIQHAYNMSTLAFNNIQVS